MKATSCIANLLEVQNDSRAELDVPKTTETIRNANKQRPYSYVITTLMIRNRRDHIVFEKITNPACITSTLTNKQIVQKKRNANAQIFNL